MDGDLLDSLAFLGIVAGLCVLFAGALRLRLPRDGRRRIALKAVLAASAVVLAFLANVAVYRNDVHLDVTREAAFTPSEQSFEVVRGLRQDVQLIYFYQRKNPAARAAKTMVELMGRSSPYLHVRTVDPDQRPALANEYGVRIYNAAVIIGGGRRIEVITTDDRDIALGILRATRAGEKMLCFASGHSEYDIDNFTYHTHFEGTHSHSHNASGIGVVQMTQHGIGRLRRALDKLGLGTRKVVLATGAEVPGDCAALVNANPRTPLAPHESKALAAYLARGGSILLLLEPDFPVDEHLAAVLARAGVAYDGGIVVDPTDHYFTDNQMVAITRYAKHPITRTLALSFFPGVRPLHPVPAPGVTSTVLATSSQDSYVLSARFVQPGADRTTGAKPIAIASEGRFGDGPGPSFRLLAVGDADFASNSFFPYMSNADLVLGMLAWLIHEERAPAMKPPVEVLPTVTLTAADVRSIFLLTVIVLPGTVTALGGLTWWRRRR